MISKVIKVHPQAISGLSTGLLRLVLLVTIWVYEGFEQIHTPYYYNY